MVAIPSQQMADLIYSFRAFNALPTEVTDQIQCVLEEELTLSIRSLINDVFKLDCFKESVDRAQVGQHAIEDISFYDDCLDRVGEKIWNLMTVPQHVVLPGDECFLNVDSDAKMKRMEIRNQIKLKIASNRELRKEFNRMKLEKQVAERLKEAIHSAEI